MALKVQIILKQILLVVFKNWLVRTVVLNLDYKMPFLIMDNGIESANYSETDYH